MYNSYGPLLKLQCSCLKHASLNVVVEDVHMHGCTMIDLDHYGSS